jgi:ribosome-associated translation inhibitor RaiA
MAMEIHFKRAHTQDVEDECTPKLLDQLQNKLMALEKFLGRTENNGASMSQVYVELGKVSESHTTGNYWRTQINLDSAGKRYHSDATDQSLKAASDKAITELKAEIQKATKKEQTMFRKGGAAVKSMITDFGTE